MHEKFPLWYSSVAIQPGSERLPLRVKGIEAYLVDVTFADLETLVRLAFAFKKSTTDARVPAFRQVFSDADASFPDGGNDRELQILAAMTLALIIEGNNSRAAYAALGITTAAFHGARPANLPMDLPGLAEAAIHRIAAENGQRPHLGTMPALSFQKLDFSAAAAQAMQGTEEGWKQAFQAIGTASRKDAMALRDHQGKILAGIENFISVQDEELQMLWWAVGGRSEIADEPFDSVPSEARPIILAQELANLTEKLPGPSSIRSLLSKGGIVNTKKISVASAVQAAYASLDTKGLEGASPITRPIHFGLSRLAEADGAEGWAPNWGAVTGLSVDLMLGSLDLAEMFFREALLQRFSED